MTSKIVRKSQLSENVFRMTLEAPLIARERKAGQFIILRCDAEWGERIPLTIADADETAGTIDIIFQSVGVSTKRLSLMNEGDILPDLVGPLGKPTEICSSMRSRGDALVSHSRYNDSAGAASAGHCTPSDSRYNDSAGAASAGHCTPSDPRGHVVVVGGGIGVAPAHPIAQAMKAAGNRVTVIMGARTKELVIMEDEMRKVADELIVVTDDGSYGRKGLVTEPLKEIIESANNQNNRIDEVVVVGPPVMMKFCALATKPFGVKTIASLNAIMIDGTGMCGGCRVTVGGETKFVCVDGPEFDAHEVDFDGFISRLGAFREEEQEHRCRSGLFGCASMDPRGDALVSHSRYNDSAGAASAGHCTPSDSRCNDSAGAASAGHCTPSDPRGFEEAKENHK